MIISEALFDWLMGLRLDELFSILIWLPQLIRARIHGTEISYQDIRICLQPLSHPAARRRPGVRQRTSSDFDTSPER